MVPINLPLTFSPSVAARNGSAFLLSHLHADAGNLPLAQPGEKATPVRHAAVPRAGGVVLLDMMLAALVHGVAHLLAEAGRRKVGCFAMDQSPVQPCRAVRANLPLQIDRGKDANAGLLVTAGVMAAARLTRSPGMRHWLASIRTTILARRSVSSRRTWAST
jgi:hypothetical protein